MTASDIYHGSNGADTRRFSQALLNRGPDGEIAWYLFRAQKASKRAKKYGPYAGIAGTSYRDLSYQRKSDSLKQLCCILLKRNGWFSIPAWGWKHEPSCGNPPYILYVEIGAVAQGGTIGQVSFHSTERFAGPDYPGCWDRMKLSESRILEFCDRVMTYAEYEPNIHCQSCGEYHRKSESCALPFEPACRITDGLFS